MRAINMLIIKIAVYVHYLIILLAFPSQQQNEPTCVTQFRK